MRKLLTFICIAVIAVCGFSIFGQIRNAMLPDQVPVYKVSDLNRYLKGDDSVKSVSYVDNPDKKPSSDVTAAIFGIVASIVALIVVNQTPGRRSGEQYRTVSRSAAPISRTANVPMHSSAYQPANVWQETWNEINKRKPDKPTSTDVFSNLTSDELLSFLQSRGLESLVDDEKAIIHSGKYYDEKTLMHMLEENNHVFPIPLKEIEELLTYQISLQDGPLFFVKISLVGTIRAERLVYTDYHGRDPRVFGEPYTVKPEDTFTVTVQHYRMQPAADPKVVPQQLVSSAAAEGVQQEKTQQKAAAVRNICAFVQRLNPQEEMKLTLQIRNDQPALLWTIAMLGGKGSERTAWIPQSLLKSLNPRSLLAWFEKLQPSFVQLMDREAFLHDHRVVEWCEQIRAEFGLRHQNSTQPSTDHKRTKRKSTKSDIITNQCTIFDYPPHPSADGQPMVDGLSLQIRNNKPEVAWRVCFRLGYFDSGAIGEYQIPKEILHDLTPASLAAWLDQRDSLIADQLHAETLQNDPRIVKWCEQIRRRYPPVVKGNSDMPQSVPEQGGNQLGVDIVKQEPAYQHCKHPLQRYENYITFDGHRYCPNCFQAFMLAEMECVKLKENIMGVRSGLYRYRKDGTLWDIAGNIAVGPSNAGYVVNYKVDARNNEEDAAQAQVQQNDADSTIGNKPSIPREAGSNMEKELKHKRLTHENVEQGTGVMIDFYFYDSSILISATHGYLDWGTGNRMGFISRNSETARVAVDGSMSIEDLRREVLKVASQLAKRSIVSLSIEDFECYKARYSRNALQT